MFNRLRVAALALLLAPSACAIAQGYDFVPWSARAPTPELLGTDLDGRVWRLSELKGRAVLINFWASWCEPCRAEMPSLQALAQTYGAERLIVLALNFKESEGAARRYVQASGLQLPVLLDPDGSLARRFGAKVFPTTVLVRADARVAGVVRGEFDWSSASAQPLVQALLASTPPMATAAP